MTCPTKNWLLAVVCVVSCRSDRSGHPSPSPEPEENARWVSKICPDAAHPNFVMGQTQTACCAGAEFWFPHDCIDKHPSEHPRDNFCRETPISGTLIIEPNGTWWCCAAGQCGN